MIFTKTRRDKVSPIFNSTDVGTHRASSLLEKLSPFDTWIDGSLAKICEHGHRAVYRKGESIQLVGNQGTTVYLLESGVFEFVVTIANGRDQALGYLHAGALLGLGHSYAAMTPVESYEYVASGEAAVWQVPSAIFRDLMWADRAMADSVLTILTTRIGNLIDAYANNCLLGAHGRVSRSLLQACRDPDFNVLWSRRMTATFSMTQSQLARMLGLSRQSVGTILREFAQAGLIRMGREKIEVLSEEGLQKIVTGRR